MTDAKQTPFARFFSSVEGHLVTRYGTASVKSAASLIGATRTPHEEGGGVTWHPEVVVAITEAEAQLYGREYDQAAREGALVERKESDWLAYREAAKAAGRKATEEAEAAKQKAEAEKADAAAKDSASAGGAGEFPSSAAPPARPGLSKK